LLKSFWVQQAQTSFQRGDENLRNALNAYGPNTYFLPIDSATRAFSEKQMLNNATYLFDVIFRSHRISNQLLFDYYLDDSRKTYYTDTGLPVSTKHRRINGQENIEISIGHVKGRILPEFRNIYCGSGVLHLVDTVMGIPGRSAYQELLVNPELSVFRSVVDMSSRFRQLLDQTPSQMLNPGINQQRLMRHDEKPKGGPIKRQAIEPGPANSIYGNNQQHQSPPLPYPQQQPQQQTFQTNNNNIRFLTILAPSNIALATVPLDQLAGNVTAIDDLLSSHIIIDNSANRVFYTDHDESIFQSGQSYSTLNPLVQLSASVVIDPQGTSNRVTLSSSRNPSLRTTITNGNSRVSNGVIHVVNKALIEGGDITQFLQQYAQGTGGSPAFNQFVDALASTGILRDLTRPDQKYTLFIPTNEALAQYNDIMIGNNQDRKKQLIYRHLCLNANLKSTNLDGLSNIGQFNTNQQMNNQLPQQQQQQQQHLMNQNYYNSQNSLTNQGINVQPGQHQQHQQHQQQQGMPGQYGNNGVMPRTKRQAVDVNSANSLREQRLRQQEHLLQQQRQHQSDNPQNQMRAGQNQMQGQNLMFDQQNRQNQVLNGPHLVCRNALGQDLALMRDNSSNFKLKV
jgi:uncharacterized surface protein with fasciclin (FAS1) repeats